MSIDINTTYEIDNINKSLKNYCDLITELKAYINTLPNKFKIIEDKHDELKIISNKYDKEIKQLKKDYDDIKLLMYLLILLLAIMIVNK